jgi:branched-chain amino acid aminotransferase
MKECLGEFYLHNGTLTNSSVFDDSFLSQPHYIYEVFRVIDGIALFLEDHLGRLEKTCMLTDHCAGFDQGIVYRNVYELIKANQLKEGNIKMVIRYGDENDDFLVYITEHQYPDERDFELGVAVALQKGIRTNPNAKVMDVKLRQQANEIKNAKEVYETLLVDKDNCITEGSRSNVFFILGEKIITPPLEDVLPGITRKHIIEVCVELNIEIVEEKVLARSIVVMEAAFFSGTSRKVLPVRQIDDLIFDPAHPVTRKIQGVFNERVDRYIHQKKT